MKIKYAINLHKAATPLFVLGLMFLYDNFTLGPWIYLALHGSYCILWLLKDRIFADKNWEEELPIAMGIVTFIILETYWIAPFMLISSGFVPPIPLVAAAIFINIIGVFLVYGSDAQKYYTLKYRRGLIAEGFFARCRNTNYLGEASIYISFALLAWHWLPFIVLAAYIAGVWIPNMFKKERSLSRYPEFAAYKANSGFFLPKLFGGQIDLAVGSDREPNART